MRRLLAVLALLTSAACGGGGAREPEAPVRYGEDTQDTTTTTSAVAAPTSSVVAPTTELANGAEEVQAAPSPARAPTSTTIKVANRTITDDPSGFRLTLVVADKLSFAPTEDIVMELTFANTTDHPLYIHADQQLFFGLATPEGEQRWTNELPACVDPPPPDTRIAVAVEPGDSNRFVRRYPGEASNPRREKCRVAAGTYLLYGFLEWCPSATPQNRVCDDSMAQRIDANPIKVTIG